MIRTMLLLCLFATGCTKKAQVEVMRVEVPVPMLQRCRAPELPSPPDVVAYKCEEGHACFDAENRAKLSNFIGVMLQHIDWLERHCTEQTIEEILMDSTEGPQS